MINLKNAGATQLTARDGGVTPWKITLDKEELYTLPAKLTPQETIDIRRTIEQMMEYAYSEGMMDMKNTKNAEIAQLLEVGNSQLNELIEERNELSLALERHMIHNQEDY